MTDPQQSRLHVLPCAVLALVAVAVTEAAGIPFTELSMVEGVATVGALLALALAWLWPGLAVVLARWAGERWLPERARVPAVAAAAVAIVAAVHGLLAFSDELALPLFAYAAWLALAAALAWLALPIGPLPRWIAAPVSLAGFAVMIAANEWLNRNGYPGFHYAMLLLAAAFASIAVIPLVGAVARRRAGGIGSWVLGALVVAVAVTTLFEPMGFAVARRFTTLGQARLALAPMNSESRTGAPIVDDEPPIIDAARPTLPGMPNLPGDLDLPRHNILLIQWEATAYRQTSLAKGGPDTTPRLRDFARGAWSFERAYSPSSNTLQSMSSLFAMKLPSTLPLTTFHRRWRGELDPSIDMVAERLARHGYETLAFGHDFGRLLSARDGIVGLTQGFEKIDIQGGSDNDPDVDARVADRAIEALEALGKERFFMWVSLVSPHAEYIEREGARGGALERYRAELRYTDEQFGRIAAALDSLEIKDNTIVVVLADHGEELGEHGGDHHGATLYQEVVHVPLIIRVPGQAPRILPAATSTLFVFPLLLGHASSPLAAEVESHVASSLAPFIQAVEGMLASEIVGHDIMKAAIIGEARSVHYDFYSGLAEEYDLVEDMGERSPLSIRPARADERSILGAYLRTRAAHVSARVGGAPSPVTKSPIEARAR